jgi:hypothetical protein
MTIEQHSNPLQAALAANSFAPDWQTIFTPRPFITKIGEPPTDYGKDQGVVSLTTGYTLQHTRVFLQPYAQGAAGSQFSMRLWGWRSHIVGRGDGARELVVPFFIAELLLTACNCPGPQSEGPAGTPSIRPLQPSENLCDTASLVQGDLGAGGWINMTAQPGAPTDLPGYIVLELQGCVAFQFDFKQQDPVGMNCLWAKL